MEECDDGVDDSGNKRQGEGCSKTCEVEVDYTCQYFSNRNPQTLCCYDKPPVIEGFNVEKDPTSNAVVVLLEVGPKLVLFESVNWEDEIAIEGLLISGRSVEYDKQYYIVRVRFTYEERPTQDVTIKIQGDTTDLCNNRDELEEVTISFDLN